MNEGNVGQELATQSDREIALYAIETRFALATKQRELLEKYIKDRLQPGKHFYKIGDDPGRKPSLTKEGAELICLPHALKAHYEWLFGPQNPPMDNTPYQITIKCVMDYNGKFAGEGIGSASSHITTKKGEHKPRQNDSGLCHNATVKMASKSAYIAATLNATAASEYYTQDLEDDQTGEIKKADQEEKKPQYFCKEHKAVWFKKGAMKNYAHPIEGSDGKWCNMPKPPEAKITMTSESEPPEEPPDEKPPDEKPPEINQKRQDLLKALNVRWPVYGISLARIKENQSARAKFLVDTTGCKLEDLAETGIDKALKALEPKAPEAQTERLV